MVNSKTGADCYMGHRRYGHGQDGFDHMSGNCGNGCHRGIGSLFGLIFAIASFAITLAFKVVGVVFQAFFGALSGIGAGSRREARWDEKNAPSFTVGGESGEPSVNKQEEVPKKDAKSNVRDFKRPEPKDGKPEAAASEEKTEEKAMTEEVRNKDAYVVLFILTMIPAIVTLAMGKLYYAGLICVAGFGMMLLVGLVSAITGSMGKKPEAMEEELEDENVQDETVEKLIKEAFDKLFEIRKDIDKVRDLGVKAEIEAICSTGEKIIGEVRTNPEGLIHVRKFFYYYLDAFGEIVRKYIRLTNFEEASQEVGKLVAETEKSFADIDAIFKELCEKLLEKDMMNLKAEINVIKNSN